MVNLAKKLLTFLLSLSVGASLMGYEKTPQKPGDPCSQDCTEESLCAEESCPQTTCPDVSEDCPPNEICPQNDCEACESETAPLEETAEIEKEPLPLPTAKECETPECAPQKENAPAKEAEANHNEKEESKPEHHDTDFGQWISSLFGRYSRPENVTEADTSQPEAKSVTESETANEILRLVNAEREKAGLKPLRYCTEAQEAADLRAKEIKTRFSHTRPDGRSCFTVFDDFAIQGSYMCAENIACGYPTAAAVMEAWMNSSGHRANILSENATALAIGINGNCYVQAFAHDYQTR